MSHFGKYTTIRTSDFNRTWKNVRKGITRCRDLRKKALAVMMATTGMRIEEATQQRWEYGWGDEGHDFIFIPESTVKGKKRSRPVCYSMKLKSALRRLGSNPRRSGFIFEGRSKWGAKSKKHGAITTRTGERWIKEIGLLGGIEDLESHDMRRIFATLYHQKSRENAGDLFGLQMMLGHQKLQTTSIYLISQFTEIFRVIASFFR